MDAAVSGAQRPACAYKSRRESVAPEPRTSSPIDQTSVTNKEKYWRDSHELTAAEFTKGLIAEFRDSLSFT